MRILSAIVGLAFLAFVITSLVSRSVGVEAGTAVRLDVSELTLSADLIVEAHILSAHAVEYDGRVETEYLLEVERTFAGDDQAYRAVRLPGGVLPDGSGMMLAGMPGIRPGEDMLLFLTAEGRSGVRMPVGLAQGKFAVSRQLDGSKRLLRDARGLVLVNQATGSVVNGPGTAVFDYVDVIAQIEAALASKRAR